MKFCMFFGLALAAGSVCAQSFQVPNLTGKPLFVPGEILVRLKSGAVDSDKARVLGAKSYTSVMEPTNGVYRLELGTGEDVQARVEQLKKDPAVDLAQPNFYYYASGACNPLAANVTYYSNPYYWPLQKIQAPRLGGSFPAVHPHRQAMRLPWRYWILAFTMAILISSDWLCREPPRIAFRVVTILQTNMVTAPM